MHVNAVTFDLSVQEIWGSLLGGCTIVVTETETALDPARLRKHIAEKGIEVGIFSTSMFNILAVQDPTAFNALKIITMCGELPSREAIGGRGLVGVGENGEDLVGELGGGSRTGQARGGVTLTDVHSGWTENRALLNKA